MVIITINSLFLTISKASFQANGKGFFSFLRVYMVYTILIILTLNI